MPNYALNSASILQAWSVTSFLPDSAIVSLHDNQLVFAVSFVNDRLRTGSTDRGPPQPPRRRKPALAVCPRPHGGCSPLSQRRAYDPPCCALASWASGLGRRGSRWRMYRNRPFLANSWRRAVLCLSVLLSLPGLAPPRSGRKPRGSCGAFEPILSSGNRRPAAPPREVHHAGNARCRGPVIRPAGAQGVPPRIQTCSTSRRASMNPWANAGTMRLPLRRQQKDNGMPIATWSMRNTAIKVSNESSPG
jgi:hypothetical protein